MKRIWKTGGAILLCLLMLFGTFITVYGARGDDDDINGGTITVTASIQAGAGIGTLSVTTENVKFNVDTYNFEGAGGEWKPGQIPKVKVVLSAADGYRFASGINAGKITIKGGGSCTGVKRLDSGARLEVMVKLKPVGGSMGAIDDAYWITSPIGKAKWDAAENANAYELKLYRDGKLVKTVDKTTTTTYDFYSYMTEEGTYQFKVRPIPRSIDESTYLPAGEWQTSDDLYIDRQHISKNTGNPDGNVNNSQPVDNDHVNFGWVRDAKGWWYHENDGSYPVNRWSQIDGKWYLFDMSGYMRIGWQLWDGKYYYLSVNGDMKTGWMEDNKKWYYLGASGDMQYGWVQLDGNWYYMHTDGVRAVGWNNVGNQWYYFDPGTGAMAVNTVVGSRYVNHDGIWVQ